MKKDIKIFVSHRIDMDSDVFESDILQPVRCGAIYDDRENVELLGDDTGDNISERRMTFCELTVQYWAWKNVDADYYGLCHYRRFFNFRNFNFPEDEYGMIVEDYIDERSANTYGLTDDVMRKAIEKYDVILGKKHDLTKLPGMWKSKSVYDHWTKAPDLHEEDLKTALDVLKRMYPDYSDDAQKYLNGHFAYFNLLHIMRKDLFYEYCEWLYPLLFELEKEIDITNYTQEGQRVVGHLAERLEGIYFEHLKRTRPELRIKELQKIIFQKPDKRLKYLKPAFLNTEKTVPIVFAANATFAPVCAVAISSVIANSNRNYQYDIIVLESDISKTDKKLIKNMASPYDNISVRFFNACGIVENYNLTANDHITVETYYRFLIQEILPDYDKVLYLDGDLVCNRDVAELYDTDIEEYLLAAAKDPDMCGQLNLPNSDVYRYLTHDVCMQNPFDYFQAGVLLLNTKEMRKRYSMTEWLKFSQHYYRYSDQDVLNRYCQGAVKYLNMSWNTLIDCNNYRVPVVIKSAEGSVFQEYHKARKNPYIIHFAGFQKPWKMRGVDFEAEFWKYARQSPYYEKFIFDILSGTTTTVYSAEPNIGVKGAIKVYLRKKVDKYCPKGTRRRYIIKKIFGRFA